MIAESGDEAFLLGNVFDNSYNDWINSSCCKAICSASLLGTLPGCCDCVYKPYCGVCPVINYAINGSITRVSKDRCKVYKGILDILFEYIYINDGEVLKIFSEWSEQA
jgi:sulfatase maturation enzyme AslB (radical SAM superfamily)